MSGERAKSRRKRILSQEEERLWRLVTQSITPLRPVAPASEPAPAAEPPAAPQPAAMPGPPAPSRPSPAATPGALDPRLMRRLRRGHAGSDAVIDLHGLTQARAHARLLAFLGAAQAAGHRIVLVVTGKGREEPSSDWWREGERGVLRRAVPAWLSTPPFRGLVAGVSQAPRRRGGEGALYVQLRRRPGR